MASLAPPGSQRLLVRPVSPFRFRKASSTAALTSSLRSYSSQPPTGSNNAVKFWPFLVIIGLGTAGYVYMVRAKAESRNAQLKKQQ